jgi:peroxiredoxin/ketosteroid isomerase-like protein
MTTTDSEAAHGGPVDENRRRKFREHAARAHEELTQRLMPDMSLTQTLAIAQEIAGKALGPETHGTLVAARNGLVASGVGKHAIRSGDAAPDFVLGDHDGRQVRLGELLAEGPVVLSFYRGSWCPMCNLELRALQARLAEVRELGAELVAVSPQPPDKSLLTAEQAGLTFPVLSDVGNSVARAYGIVMTVPDAVREHQLNDIGIDIAEHNGSGNYELPIPATYVIDTDGTVMLGSVNPDYAQRLDPDDIVLALRRLRTARSGRQVDERLGALEDREAIRDVLHRYARGADRRDVDLLKSCYWPDATDCHWFFNGNGHEFCEYVVAELLQVTNSQHSITNPIIDLEGDRAFVESQWYLVHHIQAEDASGCIAQQGEGRYIDVFERRGGEWKIRHRQIVIDQAREMIVTEVGVGDIGAELPIMGRPKPDDIVYRGLGVLDTELVPVSGGDRWADARARHAVPAGG